MKDSGTLSEKGHDDSDDNNKPLPNFSVIPPLVIRTTICLILPMDGERAPHRHSPVGGGDGDNDKKVLGKVATARVRRLRSHPTRGNLRRRLDSNTLDV